MEFTNIGRSFKEHWSSHNVEINPGVSEAALKSFEEKYGVVLPNDLRDYFRCVNGMPPDVVDDGMIRFWTLEEMEPITQVAPQYSDSSYVKNAESLFVFADYSIWAHAYAIRLGSVPLESNEILIIGHRSPVLVSLSFSDFGEHYLTDKDMLH